MEFDQATSLEGRRLGRYLLRHKLAEGGMASIYLAQVHGDQNFTRWVALKVVHPGRADDPAFATMLADEARIIARIHHPNVCSVMDFGSEGDQIYLVMEYLHGESLSAAAKRARGSRKSFPAWLAARTVADAARGLHAAHELTDEHGEPLEVVHRDVSPGNIMISYDGPAKVIDFGVVRARGRETKTQVGVVKGKITHMAPEQLLGKEVDRRADVWSLGVVLWEATLGRRLFRGSSPGETVKNVTQARIPRPSEIAPNYPPALEHAIMGALRRDVESRTATARVLAHRLEAYLCDLGSPTGHAEVATWMRSAFSDRLIVRDALMDTPEDSGPLVIAGLVDEQTQSALISGQVGTSAFAAPPVESPTGVTQVAKAPLEKKAQQSETVEEDIDRTLAELRRKKRRRGNLMLALGVLAVVVVSALTYLAMSGQS
ncbi:MAG: serine/threonine protein kinase [Deltaproteobacteria bacterium]|nr:serine/threonine protein kinase [Deltaproteobacteria bacterium]